MQWEMQLLLLLEMKLMKLMSLLMGKMLHKIRVLQVLHQELVV